VVNPVVEVETIEPVSCVEAAEPTNDVHVAGEIEVARDLTLLLDAIVTLKVVQLNPFLKQFLVLQRNMRSSFKPLLVNHLIIC